MRTTQRMMLLMPQELLWSAFHSQNLFVCLFRRFMTYRFCLMLPWMLLLANCGPKDDSPPKQLVTVKVSRAELRDVSLRLQVPATLFPKEQANLAARLVAPIRALKARKGDNV